MVWGSDPLDGTSPMKPHPNSMTNEEAKELLFLMTQLWWKFKIPDGTLQLWKNELQTGEYQITKRALHSLADDTNEWPSFAQFRAHYRAKKPSPDGRRALPAPKASKETAMQHLAEMRATLRK